jgi:cysteine-rich repeat protein
VIRLTVATGGRFGPPVAFSSTVVRVATVLAAVAVCIAATPRRSTAHGTPVPLDSWGPFGRSNARCQRFIASSAAVCALRAWQARRACFESELAGGSCDQNAVTAAIESFRIAAADSVQAACTANQVMNLVFLGVYDAANDAVTFCRELETAAVSAVTLPLPDDPSLATDEVRTCVRAAAAATTPLLHGAFRSRQWLLDRLAQKGYSPPRKRVMVARSSASVDGDAAQLAASLTAACPADAFLRTYGRDAKTFLAAIATRGDCLAGRTYAQGTLVCPPAQCGNGMREPGERCDDGNTAGGDGCSAVCNFE